ncbi:hypothetical protein ACJMK2_044174 [Sinanodonta woodiana]|uniref:Peptidase M12B domain-containing protein n=1 Tax=Sinanodonta woodiana TaxID=1069815 RepID=A0ABD3VZ86_SINWO
MEKGVFIFVVGLAAYIRLAHASLEMVWVKDATASFQTDKRTLGELDLPNELTFHLKRGTDALTLNLMKNHAINPNADVYFAHKLQDGKSYFVKSENAIKSDVAYYQDIANGAYMTVRCVKRSNEECDRVINGNIRIGDIDYDLQPVVADATSRNLFQDQRVLGKRYVLQAHTFSRETNSVEDVEDIQERTEQRFEEILQQLNGQHKNRHFRRADASLPSQNVADLHNGASSDKSSRSREDYYVDILVMIDPGLWELHSSLVKTSNFEAKREKVKVKIREYFSHIINGVNLRYKEIDDPTISITVTLSGFLFFQTEGIFPHLVSKVDVINGTKYIEREKYLFDLFYWEYNGTDRVKEFDQALLFTRYDLYGNYTSNNRMNGVSFTGGVCIEGRRFSIIEASDYSLTMRTAAHELGHGLGAVHDGERDAKDCKASDLFLMAPLMYSPNIKKNYTKNPWIFSNCSVNAFKKTLKFRACVKVKGNVYDEYHWNSYTMKEPGEVYSLDHQCSIANGGKSKYCGVRALCVCAS